MIEIKSDQAKHEMHATASGSMLNVVTELLLAIGEIYLMLSRRNKGAGEAFRKALLVGLRPDAPTWSGYGGDTAAICVVRDLEEDQ